MVSFPTPFPERLYRGQRRSVSTRLWRTLRGPWRPTDGDHWLLHLETVLGIYACDAVVLDAIERGERELVRTEGLVFVERDASEVGEEARALWAAHTGTTLEGPVYSLSPSWLRGPGNVIPRDVVIALIAPQVSAMRHRVFPWLFCEWPCSTEPAQGEEALLRALEARADRVDDALLFEADALGIVRRGAETRAVEAKRRALARWGLPRLGALLDAAIALRGLAGHPDRFAVSQWNGRATEPPFSLRYFLDGAPTPDGVTLGGWVGACELVVRRIPAYPVEAGAEGEWVASVLGRRVALRFAMEHGMPMLTGFRTAGEHEPETPLLAEPDNAREEAMWRESCRLFVRPDVLRQSPSAQDLRYLAWLDRAWAEASSSRHGLPREALGPRRTLLLGALETAGLLQPHEPIVALLAERGHPGLLRAADAVRELLRYLKSPERHAHTRCGYYGSMQGAWVSPLWFLQDDPVVHDVGFTARCEAVLHPLNFGTAWEGEVRATIDGAPRIVRWRRETGLFPALAEVAAPEAGDADDEADHGRSTRLDGGVKRAREDG